MEGRECGGEEGSGDTGDNIPTEQVRWEGEGEGGEGARGRVEGGEGGGGRGEKCSRKLNIFCAT